MKLWEIEYAEYSSSYEKSVILAEAKGDALKTAEELVKEQEMDWQYLNKDDEYDEEKIKAIRAHTYLSEVLLSETLGEPVESYIDLEGGCITLKNIKVHIKEISLDKPTEIYTGFYCC